ncbi:pyridoxal phosphate-dependent aminotransferase [Sandaracinobacteroides sp. A072]|uniref:pyridoxal phosphate-dependent aminotransferase n=1 Tax=Sandaracinobacteroides sp. A072 TaxID=3461146 RepID=UPI004041F86E
MAEPALSPAAARLAAAGQASAWAIADEALRRVAAGEDILLMTLGDPVCPPHPAIVEATCKALHGGRTHYTPLLGEPALRAAVARAEGCAPDDVVIVPGAQHAALSVMAMIAGEGDEVILSAPYYATYPGVVASSGARPHVVPSRPDLSIDVEAIAAAITPATRAIFLNSPCNPSGAALTQADFARLSGLCTAHDLWLVVDEVYARFRFDGAHVGAWANGPAGRTVVLNSLSKSHAMTGYRIGWVLAPPALVRALADWQAAALFGVSQFVQDAAVAALSLPESAFATYRSGFARRAAQVVERANAIPGLSARMPVGGMFVMLDIRGIHPDDRIVARRMLDEAGVAVVPGSGFGPSGQGHVRVSLTGDAAMLDRAFDRIALMAAASAGLTAPLGRHAG